MSVQPGHRAPLIRPADPIPFVVRWDRPARQSLAAVARLAAAGGVVAVPNDPWLTSYRFTGSVADDAIVIRVTPTARPDPVRTGPGSLPLMIEGRIRDVGGGASEFDGQLRAEVSATWWVPLALAAIVVPGLAIVGAPVAAGLVAAALLISVPIVARGLSARQAGDLARAGQIKSALASI
jgi:hypothetical protein